MPDNTWLTSLFPAGKPATPPGEDTSRLSWDTLLGAVKAIPQSIAHLVGNVAQDVTPFDLRGSWGATEAPVEGVNPAERARRLAGTGLNAVLLGLPDAWEARYNQTPAGRNIPSDIEHRVTDLLSSGAEALGKDVLPGREIAELFTGKDAAGNRVSNEQFGADIATGLLKVDIAGGMVGHTFGKIGGGADYAALVSREAGGMISTGEIAKVLGDAAKKSGHVDDAVAAAKGTVAAVKAQLPGAKDFGPSLAKEIGDSSFSASIPRAKNVIPEDLMNTIQSQAFANDTMRAELMGNMALRMANKESLPVNQVLANAMRSGKWTPEVYRDLLEKGEPFEVADLATAVEQTATYSGQTLQHLSKLSQAAMERMYQEAMDGVPGAAERLRDWSNLSKMHFSDVDSWNSLYKWGMQNMRTVEKVRRALITSTPAVMFRNTTIEAANLATTFIESKLDALGEAVRGVIREPKNPNTISAGEQFFSLPKYLSPNTFSAFNEVVDSIPYAKRYLKDARDFTTTDELTGKISAGQLPSSAGDFFEKIANYVSFMNRFQVRQFRMAAATTRFAENLRAIGLVDDLGDNAQIQAAMTRVGNALKDTDGSMFVKDGEPAGAITDATKAPITEAQFRQIKEAMADSTIHAMKITHSLEPTGGFSKAYIDFSRQNPWMTALGPTFPRFLYNQWTWISERNPVQLFNIFSKSYRDLLWDGHLGEPMKVVFDSTGKKVWSGKPGEFEAKLTSHPEWTTDHTITDVQASNLWASAEAKRQFGKAMSGAVLLTGAYALRQSPYAGEKYWEVNPVGNTGLPGVRNMFDFRNMQPFVSYLALAHLIDVAVNNKPLNLNVNEQADMIMGVRRLNDVPLFDVEALLHEVNAGDPDFKNKLVKRLVGNYAAGFTRPMGYANMFFPKETNKVFNLEGQELTGPVRQAFQALSPITGDTLPERINPYTGEPYKNINYIASKVFGIQQTQKSLLQRTTESLGLDPSHMMTQYNNPTLDGEYARRLGGLLSHPLNDNTTVGDHLAELVQNVKGNTTMKQFVLRSIMTNLKQEVGQSLESDPRYTREMIEYRLKHSPELGPLAIPLLESLRAQGTLPR